MGQTLRRTAWLLAGTLVLLAPAASRAAETSDTAEAVPGKIVVFRLHGQLREAPPTFDLGLNEEQVNFYDLLTRMSKAKKDSKVKALVLLFDEPQIGWAQRQEIRQAISDLKAADKDVYCVLEDTEGATYMMTTGASRIYMTPTGELGLVGLHLEHAYFKKLLDKIGVQADIEHMGAYKGAGEPFTRTGPSDEAKEMLNWLVKDLFDQMVQQIAEDRKLEPDKVRELIDRGPFNAKDAVAAKLIDEIAYPDEIVKGLKERYGESVELVHNYGERKLPEIDLSSPFGLFKFFGEMMSKSKAASKSQIAVVYVDGMIVAGKTEDDLFGDNSSVGSTNMRRILTKIHNNDMIKAVVLRVDSPGGSAVASDIIWHAAELLGKDKPLIVSMGNVAASGGYYVSCGAATIFADPGTITGSIGVIGGKLVTQGLWNWIGIDFDETNMGKNADLYNTNRPFSEDQRVLIRKYMKDVYDVFKQRVTEGRKDKLKGEIEDLAGGRVYTGRQAMAKGLVDRLGGLQEAIQYAASESKTSSYEVAQYPEPKNFLEMFFKNLAGEEDDENDESVQLSSGWLLKSPQVDGVLKQVARIDPAKARMLQQMLFRLELLSRESTLLVMPGDFLVR